MTFPVVVTHAQAQRVRAGARLLILGRELRLGDRPHIDPDELADQTRRVAAGARLPSTYDLHDGAVVRRNQRWGRQGRLDLKTDPLVATIELLAVAEATLADIDRVQARKAGYYDVDDLFDDWRRRRRRAFTSTLPVFVHAFEVVDARYLHRRVHLGYTSNPDDAVVDEPAALSPEDTELMARRVRHRDALIRAARRAQLPLEDRVRDLVHRAERGDRAARRHLFVIERRIARAQPKPTRRRDAA